MRRVLLCASTAVCVIVLIGLVGCHKTTFRKGQTNLVTYPVGKQLGTVEGSVQKLREAYYIRPRAYPTQVIDDAMRLGAFRQLQDLRTRLHLRHINPGWSDWAQPPAPPPPGPPSPAACVWFSMGPTNISGRVTSIAIDPNNHQRIFATSVGGIWLSVDGGRRWQRVSDDFIATVFASVAVNPTNGAEVYAGAGDPNYAHIFGNSGIGIWHSAAGGAPGTWVKVSPPELDGQVIFRLRIDPAPPNNVYAATSAGVYLGTGGSSWSRLGGFDARTSDLVVDFSSSPRKVYAGVYIPNRSFGRGIWKHNGISWGKRDSGIQTSEGGAIALALAASQPSTLFAKVEHRATSSLMGVFKTTTAAEIPLTGGNAWRSVASDQSDLNDCEGFSYYNSVIEVDPTDPMIVYDGGRFLWRTVDGGNNWEYATASNDPGFSTLTLHDDQHAVAFDPANSKVVFAGNDGGIFRSSDTSSSTWHWNQVSHGMLSTEFYKVTSQESTATVLAGGSQDNGTEITFGNRTWYSPFGCDGFNIAVDAGTSETLYGDCNDTVHEFTNPIPGTGVSVPEIDLSALASGVTLLPPFITDRSTPGAALSAGKSSAGVNVILKTIDGVNWTATGPALPADAEVVSLATGASSSFQAYYAGIGTLSRSITCKPPKVPPAIWRTFDRGATWNTKTTGLPSDMWPNGLAIDYTDPTRAFAVFGGCPGGAVLISTNGGADWTGLAGTGANALPNAPVLGVAIDPYDSAVIYIATSIGVFRGVVTAGLAPAASWAPFDDGLPDGLDVNDIAVNRATGVLSIGSVGHGVFQRDIRPGVSCPSNILLVRDNVFDRGLTPSPSGVPDPEHPIPDPARPGFYKPDDSRAGQLYWWDSTDIRIDVPSVDPPGNQILSADGVEMETCPIEISSCPAGTMLDSSPIRGQPAKAYVQVMNLGVQPASNVRVLTLWADATAGAPLLPSDFWTTTFPAGSVTCGPLNTSTGWNAVDPTQPCRLIPVVNPERPEVVQFPWNVPNTAPQHSCLLAIVESAGDLIPASVRGTNEVRPWVLVPGTRQIALRNLHIVDSPPGSARLPGLEILNMPGSERGGILDLVISRATMGKNARLGVILPAMQGIRLRGVKQVPGRLSPDQQKIASSIGLDPSVLYEVTEPEGELVDLRVPGSPTWRIALQYDSVRGEPNTAVRFTVLARQHETILGGSTYVLRFRPMGAPRRGTADSR